VSARATACWVSAALCAGAAVLSLAPAGAAAATCDVDLRGANQSFWQLDPEAGALLEAFAYDAGRNALRDDAIDEGHGELFVDGVPYANPNPNGCKRAQRGREYIFPSAAVGDVRVTRRVYVDRRRTLARQLDTIRNTGASRVTVDLEWVFQLGSDAETIVAASSSGDANVNGADRWGTSCEDLDADGCADVADEEFRDPEIALNWERQRGRHDSADSVVYEDANDGIPTVGFENVRIKAGKTVSYMQITSLAFTPAGARRTAGAIGRDPQGFGLFRGLRDQERARIRNW
jgi:hypothetical protein